MNKSSRPSANDPRSNANYMEFGDQVTAHLRYAATLGGKQGVAILLGHLHDATWAKAPNAWLNAASRLGRILPLPAACAELARVVGKSAAHKDGLLAILGNVILTCAGVGDRASIAAVFAAFLKYADAGDAGVLLDALIRPGPDGLPPSVIDWLLQHGTGELRSKDRAGRVARLAILLATESTHDQNRATKLLRMVIAGEHPAGAWSHGYSNVSRGRRDSLWNAIEVGLEHGLGQDDIVQLLDVPRQIIVARGNYLLEPLSEPHYPRAREFLLRALAAGKIVGPIVESAWRAAMSVAPPRALAFDLSSLAAAFHELNACAHESRRSTIGWAKALSIAYFDRFGPCRTAEPHLPSWCSPSQLSGWSWFQKPIRDSLGESLRRHADREGVGLAIEILSRHDEPLAVDVALATLPPWRPDGRAPDRAAFRSRVEQALAALLANSWPACAGIDLQSIRANTSRVEICELDDSDQVRVEGERLLLHSSYVDAVAAEPDAERAVALCVLFFFHELVHVVQEIRKKATVCAIRDAGAEMPLKHLDLHADHVAASFTAALHPGRDLVALKDLQASAVGTFPVGRFHTRASRARKAGRFVSLRADLLARREGIVERDSPAYLFVEYAPLGGTFVLMESGTVTRVVRIAKISAQAADSLASAADGSADAAAAVDKVLYRILAPLRA